MYIYLYSYLNIYLYLILNIYLYCNIYFYLYIDLYIHLYADINIYLKIEINSLHTSKFRSSKGFIFGWSSFIRIPLVNHFVNHLRLCYLHISTPFLLTSVKQNYMMLVNWKIKTPSSINKLKPLGVYSTNLVLTILQLTIYNTYLRYVSMTLTILVLQYLSHRQYILEKYDAKISFYILCTD